MNKVKYMEFAGETQVKAINGLGGNAKKVAEIVNNMNKMIIFVQ